jgi:GTP-binding protein Era
VVEKQSQKRIVVGRAGRMIKTIGTRARKEIQRFLGVRRVALELQVSVAPEWRNREGLLDRFGVV